MEVLILIIVGVITLSLVRYSLKEYGRTKRLKRLWRDIAEHDKKNKNNE